MCLYDNLCIPDLLEVAEKYDFELFIKHTTVTTHHNINIIYLTSTTIYFTPVAQWNSPVTDQISKKNGQH